MTNKLDFYLISKFNELGYDYDRMSSSGKKIYDDLARYINNRAAQYLKCFPDFDNGFAFDNLLNYFEDQGFTDISYKNDACPSIGVSLNNLWRDYVTVFIDYDDQSKSQFEDMDPQRYYRFNIQRVTDDQGVVEERATNEFYEAVYYIYEMLSELHGWKDTVVYRHRMDLRNYEGEWTDAYVLETTVDDTDPEEFLENTLHIEVLGNGHLHMMLDRSCWTYENTSENLEHLTRMLLGWAISEGYYDGFAIVKDANND